MPRKLHIAHPDCPYHVSARSHGGSWFNLPIEVVWEIMTNYLYFIRYAYGVKIYAFVLMNNHFHLLIATPKANLSQAMNYFMRETSKEINRLSGEINQVYGNRHFRSVIEDQLYFNHVYKYIYRNPVTAGLIARCEEYRFSTLRGLLGQLPIYIPIEEDKILFENGNIESTLKWLNTPPEMKNYETLRKALRRKVLKFPKNQWNHLKHSLEMHPY